MDVLIESHRTSSQAIVNSLKQISDSLQVTDHMVNIDHHDE